MNRSEIHFVIDRDGNIQSTIKGIKGSGCGTIAAEIEKLGRVAKQERTKAYYERCDEAKNLLKLAWSKSDSTETHTSAAAGLRIGQLDRKGNSL
jgi:hypothetical protein